jgi:sulfite reductase beta subunit-like hemoprotein
MDGRTWPDAAEVAEAWRGVTDQWIVRRNKAHERAQWEVVHDWGGEVIDEATQAVVARYSSQIEAHEHAERLENAARGAAVLAIFTKWKAE